MTFPTIVFGSYEVGIGYSDGSSIPTGGLRVFVVPTINISSPMDVGITYIDQFGNTKTTLVTTSIPTAAGGGTTGSHFQMVLNSGDTGIRDIISISVIGGSPGDKFNLESWNEGLGRSPYPVIKSEPNPQWTESGPIREIPYLQRVFLFIKNFPYPYLSSNPIIPIPISLNTLCPRITPGYPSPPQSCTGGDFLSEPLSGNTYFQKIYFYFKLCPRVTPGYPSPPQIPPLECTEGTFIQESLSGRQFLAKRFAFLKTWLESVVGQVVSGYVQNLSGDTIRNAFSLIVISTTSSDTSPGGSSLVANVNPDTGLYQAFFKSMIYDKRYIIIKIGIKNIVLEGAGIPTFIDGSQKLEIPYNLQFACPVIDCDFNITRKI